MSKSVVQYNSTGIGFGGALFLVFLVLKLTGKIAWSWWWVTSPLWVPVAIIVAVLAVIFMMWLAVQAASRWL